MRFLSEKDREERERKKKAPSWKYSLPFFAALAVLTVVSFLIPLRPTRSNVEKRDLAVFPEFSVEALTSGTYFDDITLWFSDTFPGREGWLNAADYYASLYGYSEISIDGVLQQTDVIPVVTQPVPQEAQDSYDEPLPEAPTEPESAPEESEPAAPEEEEWGGMDAGDAAEIIQSQTAIQIGDAVFGAQGFSQNNSDKYIKVLNSLAKGVAEKDVTVVSAIPPTAIGILIEEEYLAKLNSVNQLDILNYLHAGMDESIVKVDTVTPLIAHNSEYIYFRTDHHWTALGAYYFYEATMQALDLEYVDINDLEVWPQGDFKGSQVGRAAKPWALKVDYVDAYIPIGDIVNTVYSGNGSGRGSDWPILTDCTERELNAKYMVFGTDYAMTHAENRSIPDAPNVLLVKDSFGNCVVPFMTQTFNNVYAIDYRKFRANTISLMIDQYDIDYIIVMPNITATQAQDGPTMVSRVMGYW